MIHIRPFGLSVPGPYLHMLGSSSLTRVFCTCKTGFHPLYVNVELITPDHHVVCLHDELSQRCILRENTCTLKFSERSSYNATVNQSKIRCTKKKDTSVTFWAERTSFLSYLWHFYDDNCDKTWYHHRCGGLLLLWQKFMTENGLFVLGGPETQLHDILWAVHDEKELW